MPKKNVYNQLLAMTPVNLQLFVIGYGTGFAPVLDRLRRQKSSTVSEEQLSMIKSIFFVGEGLGPFVQSLLVDRRGRNFLFVVTALLSVLQYAVLLVSELDNVHAHYVARLANGMASGIGLSIVGAYIAENCSPTLRGTFVGLIGFHSSVGRLVAYVLQAYFSYQVGNAFAQVFALFSLLGCLFMLKEPAQYLVMKGRVSQAERNFHWLRGVTDETGHEFRQIRAYIDRKRSQEKQAVWQILSTAEVRRSLTIVTITGLLSAVTGKSVITFEITSFLEKGGNDVQSSSSSFVYRMTILFGLVHVFMRGIGASIIERFPRKSLFVASNATVALFCVLPGVLYVVDPGNESSWLTVVKFASMTLSTGVTGAVINPLCTSVIGELLPQHAKGVGSAVTVVVGSIGGFLTNYYSTPITRHLGMHWNFFMYAFFAVCAVFFTSFFLPETRGKTLVQIQDELERKCGGTLMQPIAVATHKCDNVDRTIISA